jgi:hypothetical protein
MDLALVTLSVGALSAGCVMLGNNTFYMAREDGGACRSTIACLEFSRVVGMGLSCTGYNLNGEIFRVMGTERFEVCLSKLRGASIGGYLKYMQMRDDTSSAVVRTLL